REPPCGPPRSRPSSRRRAPSRARRTGGCPRAAPRRGCHGGTARPTPPGGFRGRAVLEENGRRMALHVAGVRHHSPACAKLVGHVIRTVRPRHVLIEGPSDMNGRLAELYLPHRLPVAVLSYA